MAAESFDRRGIILTKPVDLEYLQNIEPKFHGNMMKFDINMKEHKVSVGMDAHKNYVLTFADNPRDVIGGFINLKTGEVSYDSTLNIKWNLEIGSAGDTLREIIDKELISTANSILDEWVKL